MWRGKIPNPETITTSDAFSAWCKAVVSYIDNFEENLLRTIGQQQHPNALLPRLVQTVAGKDDLARLQASRLFPMVAEDNEYATPRLFAPLSNSQIAQLEAGEHSCIVDGHAYPVRLRRTRSFVDLERELLTPFGDRSGVAGLAKEFFFPDLSFPFLPFSRKFLDVDVIGYHGAVSTDNIVLRNGYRASELNMRNDVVPVWNVRLEHEYLGKLKCNSAGRYCWTPNDNSKLARKWMNDSAGIVVSKAIGKHQRAIDLRLVSREYQFSEDFPTLYWWVVWKVANTPQDRRFPIVGLEESDQMGNYWYRTHLQSKLFTQRDVDMLLALLPETRRHVRCTTIETNPIDEGIPILSDFANEEGFDRFSNFLWYLADHRAAAREDPQTLRTLGLTFKRLGDIKEREQLLVEDRMNYALSLLGLFLPDNIRCVGHLGAH